MLYLIGGPGRSGKTTLAMKLASQRGIPYFSLDYLMMGLYRGAPSLGIDPNQPEALVAPRMHAVVKPLATAMVENGEEYCLEGFAITPELVGELADRFSECLRACFLGYCTADPLTKLEQERNHPSTNPWPADVDDAKAIADFAAMKAASLRLAAECSKSGMAFFDTSHTFESVIDAAASHMLSTSK